MSRHLRIIGMTGAPPILAVTINVLSWLEQHPFRGDSWSRILDVLLLLSLSAYVIGMGLTVHRRRRLHAARNIYLSVMLWLATPGIAAYALWDSEISARDWLVVSWKWALKPLPVDIPEAMAWRIPKVPVGIIEGCALVGLQLTTVALLLSSVAIALDEFQKRAPH